MPPIAPVSITAFTVTCAPGAGRQAFGTALRQGRSGLRRNDFTTHPLDTWIGRVAGVEDVVLPPALAACDARNNRLAWLGLQADGFLDAVASAVQRHGPARVGLCVGTSTSTIGETEAAYRHRGADGHLPPGSDRPEVHTPHALGLFLQRALGVTGPTLTVSTACSSSAKAFAVAERWLRLGLVDAVVVGGVDTLCQSVLFGFNGLQLVSPQPCRPFDAARDGINLAEAAGYALLERGASALQLLGWGESSDAHHMSSPHPQGLGAERALDDCLRRAGLSTDEVDLVNLHGTASAKNDEVEAALVARRFGPQVHASSTKGWTGHALGAAGIVESVACLIALESGWRPGTLNTTVLDAAAGPQIRLEGEQAPVRVALNHSFGFGGSNCVLAFGRPD